MRFCDKLSKLRKENNFSQEQFADKLGVSRQAVSKWESGSSYPDMDKIITMCKILNCNLEDLMDDGVIGDKKTNSKINLNDYINDFLSFITKTYNMFWSMKFKEKIKCLFEMFIIFMVLFIAGMIIYSIISSLFLYNFSDIVVIGSIINRVIEPLIIIALIIIGIIIFIHLFKIRYLDYFVTIEDNEVKEKQTEKAIVEEKIIDNKKYIVERQKEKIVIRDPKHSISNFLNIFVKMFIYIIKFCTIMFLIPFIIFIVVVIGLGAISVTFVKYGMMFLFISLGILGIVLLSFIVLYFAYNFIFNREIKFRLMFILSITGFILLGTGFGVGAISFMDYDKVKLTEDRLEVTENEIEMKDNIVFSNRHMVNFVIDNSVNNIKIKTTTIKGTDSFIYTESIGDYEIYHIDYSGFDNIFDAYDFLKEDLKNHQLSLYEEQFKIDVYISEENYNKLKENEENYYQDRN